MQPKAPPIDKDGPSAVDRHAKHPEAIRRACADTPNVGRSDVDRIVWAENTHRERRVSDPGVFQDVGESFLCDALQLVLIVAVGTDFQRDERPRGVGVDVGVDLSDAGNRFHVLFQGPLNRGFFSP